MNIKKFVAIVVLAVIALVLPAVASDAISAPEFAGLIPGLDSSCCNPGQQMDGDALTCAGLPCWAEPCKVNFDAVEAGDQKAWAFGSPQFPWRTAVADNQFNLLKDQDVCCDSPASVYNYEFIEGGDQFAFAVGFASATNSINIETAQG